MLVNQNEAENVQLKKNESIVFTFDYTLEALLKKVIKGKPRPSQSLFNLPKEAIEEAIEHYDQFVGPDEASKNGFYFSMKQLKLITLSPGELFESGIEMIWINRKDALKEILPKLDHAYDIGQGNY